MPDPSAPVADTVDLPPGDSAFAPTLAPSPSANVAAAEPAPRFPTIDGYTIINELGRGGMGVVSLARQDRLNRLVALKMILAGSAAGGDALARFQTEAHAVARLQHPNI